MMHFGLKEWVSLVIGLLLIVVGLLPQFGISLLPIGGIWRIGLLLAALIFLIIDGFGEEHMLRTVTLLCGLLIGLFLAIPMANSAGWIPFTIPTYLLAFEGYIQGLCGLLLIIGSFKA